MRLLLSPLGMSPGLLYSAIMLIKPETVLILTSKEAQTRLPEIFEHCNYLGEQVTIKVDDPFLAFDQWERIKPIAEIVSETDEVWVNITGGTTALQYLVQKAARHLIDCGRMVHTVALIDRRGVFEQKANPYEVGEMVVLAE